MSRHETFSRLPRIPASEAPPCIGLSGRRAGVLTALFARYGYQTARAAECDVWVLDVDGTPLDGLGALRGLAARAPVIMLSERCETEERLAAFDHGAAAVLPRPVDRAELIARVEALARRRKPATRPRIRVAGVEIDPARRTASMAGSPAPLTANEFLLLSYLARHAGRVVPRAELGLNLLAGDEDMASNVVEVTVSRIRRKLRPDVILTRRGEGYLAPASEIQPVAGEQIQVE